MLASIPFAKGLPGPTTKIRIPTVQMRAVESVSVAGDTLVANPARITVATWTEGAIEVSHQGVAIASAYAGTTRIVAMMASGPMPSPQRDGSESKPDNNWTTDEVHAIKLGVGAGARTWTGIAPDGNVWTGGPRGIGTNHGHFSTYLP
jgi:hypothetical protein